MIQTKAEAIMRFYDLKAEKTRELGEMFTVSKERFRELEEKGVAKEAEKTIEEEQPEE